jgi:hypothetical protein
MMAAFGTRLAAVDEIVRQTAADPSVTEIDCAVLASRLEHAARQVRAIGACCRSDPTIHQRPPHRQLGRAA